MKRFLLIPSCALLALGMLTSCQKEDKTAKQLAEELTATLQTVTDYKTAEAAAPRVEALNKRFQNANARVFSVGGNALSASGTAYADSVAELAKEIGRVRASKPVTSADGEIDDTRLIRTVGIGAGSTTTAPAREQIAKGQAYIYNDSDQANNNPPAFAECYGSSNLVAALEYTAEPGKFGLVHFDSAEDVPAIPEAKEVAESEDDNVSADDVKPETADDSTPAAADDAEDDTTTTPAADDDDTTPAPAATTTSSDDDDDLDLGDDADDSSSSSSSSSSSDDDDELSIDDDL